VVVLLVSYEAQHRESVANCKSLIEAQTVEPEFRSSCGSARGVSRVIGAQRQIRLVIELRVPGKARLRNVILVVSLGVKTTDGGAGPRVRKSLLLPFITHPMARIVQVAPHRSRCRAVKPVRPVCPSMERVCSPWPLIA